MALDADIIKEEDTYRWQPTLENPRTGTTYDLTDATEVRLYVDHLRSDTLVVNSAVEIVDAANGKVAYDFSRAETARAGTHRAEFVVEETDGDYVTVPNDGYVKLDFTAMLPRGADLEPATADTDVTVATLTATDWIESPVARLDSVTTEDATITKGIAAARDEWNPLPTLETNGPLPYFISGGVGSSPIATAADVTDETNVTDVADPFARKLDQWYLCAEIIQSDGDPAMLSMWHGESLQTLAYDQVILDPADHSPNRFAYPHWRVWDGHVYMIPAIGSDEVHYVYDVDLSTFKNVPNSTDWSETHLLTTTNNVVDLTVFYFQGTFYAIGRDVTDGQIRLYYDDAGAAAPTGINLVEHPSSPIHTDGGATDGPAGRPVVSENDVKFFYQDAREFARVSQFVIGELTTTTFSDHEAPNSPIVPASGGGTGTHWLNESHHIDPQLYEFTDGPLAIVDGNNGSFQVGVVTPTDSLNWRFSAHLDSDVVGAGGILPFDDVHLDTGGMFDKSTGEYVVPEDGHYTFGAKVVWENASATPAKVFAGIRDTTNATYLDNSRMNLDATFRVAHPTIHAEDYLEEGTRVGVDINTINITADVDGGDQSTRFWGYRVQQ